MTPCGPASPGPTRGGGAAPVWLVTVLYKCRDCLPAFADSLRAQAGADWRLVAIDNASADGAGALLAGLGDARIAVLRNRRNLGFARAANQGLRAALAAGADRVVLLNNDTVLPPGFLSRFLAAWTRLGAEVVTPRIMHLDRPDLGWYAGGHFVTGWVFLAEHEPYDPADTRAVRVVEYAPGCCLGLARAVLERVGLLDERFFVYGEDADFCLRLRRDGTPIHYLNDLVLLHEGAHSLGGPDSPAALRLHYRSHVQLLRKHFGTAAALRIALRLTLRVLQRPDWALPPRQFAAMQWGLLRGLLAPGHERKSS